MSKKFGLIILVLLAMLLSACEWSQSTPAPTAQKKNSNKVQATPKVVDPLATIDPLATNDPMILVQSVATQTAAALTGVPMDSAPATLETATPQIGIEQPTIDPGLPTTTGNAPQPTVQTTRPTTYTLKQDEFIFCLARRFNVDPAEMLALNGLWDSEIIQPGLTVRIPASGSFPGPRALKSHPVTYTVQTGDTIYKVACLYGDVQPVNIAAVNGLEAPYTLTVGAQILIP